jgi:hypothetical protein
MSDFQDSQHRKARVAHQCAECHKIIRPGDEYESVRGRSDGTMYNYAMCHRCSLMWSHAVDAFGMWDVDDRPAMGGLRLCLKEDFDVPDPDVWLEDRVHAAKQLELFTERSRHSAQVYAFGKTSE